LIGVGVLDDDRVDGTAVGATGCQDKAAGISLIDSSGAGLWAEASVPDPAKSPYGLGVLTGQQMVLREMLQVTLLRFASKTSARSMQPPSKQWFLAACTQCRQG
jgi:hypothetical protein